MGYAGDGRSHHSGFYGDDEDAPRGGIFTPESHIQDNITLTLNGGATTLLDVGTVGQVPRMMTVSWGVIGPRWQNAVGIQAGEVVAALEIGIGGLMFTTDVDMILGQTFSFAASHLKLTARYVSPAGIPLPAPPSSGPPQVKVGASVTEGVIAHGRQPQRTLGDSVLLLPGAAGRIWEIPTFAKSFRVVVFPVNANADVEVFDNAGNPLAIYSVVSFPSEDLPLPNGATNVVFVNPPLSGVNIDMHRLVFELGL